LRKKIGECLIGAGLITDDDLRSALEAHRRTGERLGAVMVRMNLATERQVAKVLALQLGFPYVDLAEEPPDPSAVLLIPKPFALKHVCIPVGLDKNQLTVAMSDPLRFSLVQDLESQTGHRVVQIVSARGDILEAIQSGYPDTAPDWIAQPGSGADIAVGRTPGRGFPRELGADAATAATAGSEGASIIELVDVVVKSAIQSGASDVHVEPMEKGVLVRHRLDGVLKEVMELPKAVHEAMAARLKIMAGMDIAEERLPQDGRLRSVSEDGTAIDFRVSTLRTLYGEKIVMRLVGHSQGVPSLEDTGLSASALDEVRQFLKHQRGLVLVVGPKGSGKSTTLAAALGSVQHERINIITIEDPVEYRIPGVNQTEINEKIELTFASAMRSILRQHPDVVLIGEIRDADTLTVAMQAASGLLVLSALSTDEAPSAVTRLTNMGGEPVLVAGALVGIVAQRLVRRLCSNCRRQYSPQADTLRALNISQADAAVMPFHEAVGCDQCSHTGYRGRIGIYQVMRVTDRLRRLIAAGATEDQIGDAAREGGMISLGEDGLAKVKSGRTTLDELVRVVTDLRDARTLCGGCGSAVGVDFVACPNCGKRLGAECPQCHRALQPGWNFCPYCTNSTGESTRRPPRLREAEGRESRLEMPAANVVEFEK
jgi:type IV pilus assembly protein PilB